MKTLIPFMILWFTPIASAQQAQAVHDDFNFWIGNWEGSWYDENGNKGIATNEITTILDGRCLQEKFEVTSGQTKGFKGMSISTFIPSKGVWKQNWFDAQGGYFAFTSAYEADKKIFITDLPQSGGKIRRQRMVFYDIKEDSFTWDWEWSDDGGATWNLSWKIAYKRI